MGGCTSSIHSPDRIPRQELWRCQKYLGLHTQSLFLLHLLYVKVEAGRNEEERNMRSGLQSYLSKRTDGRPIVSESSMNIINHWENRRSTVIKDGDSEIWFSIGAMAWRALKDHIKGCHFLMVTSSLDSPLVTYIIGSTTASLQPLVLMNVGRKLNIDPDYLLEMWGEDNTVCRVVLIDLMSDGNDVILGFLESNKITNWPDAWIIIVGGTSNVGAVFSHDAFRNTLQPIYLSFKDSLLQDVFLSNKGEEMSSGSNAGKMDIASVYSRCLYCGAGNPEVRLLFLWPLGSDLPYPLNPFPDQYSDLQGHMFRVVTLPVFPFNAMRIHSKDQPASKVTLLDSLDKRLLVAISNQLNFTYETRVPWVLEWGISTASGNFTGMVGTIQYNEADFTTTVAPTPNRTTVLDTTRAYRADLISVVSLKPQLLPQYLVILRPFSKNIWMYLVISIFAWGFALWLLQNLSLQSKKESNLTLIQAIFYSWAVMLEDPPQRPPTNITGQVAVCVWLLASFVITTGYKSALVAHLAVQLKTEPIDSFVDLVNRGDFRWGMEGRYLTGAPRIYFETTTDPVVQTVYNHLERLESYQEGFDKVRQGKYAFICFETLSRILVNSYYTDELGYSPYYVSKKGFSMVPYLGWGYGKGAPFRRHFNMMMSRLIDAGILDRWKKEIVASKVRTNRKMIQKDSKAAGNGSTKHSSSAEDSTGKLRIVHLIGVFLVFFIGLGTSLSILLMEVSFSYLGIFYRK